MEISGLDQSSKWVSFDHFFRDEDHLLDFFHGELDVLEEFHYVGEEGVVVIGEVVPEMGN